jgi:glycosyltransferase involved in cell wall biosynthesis
MNIVWYSPYALAGDTGTANIMLAWCEALVDQGANVAILVDSRKISRPAPKGVRRMAVDHRLPRRLSIPVGVHTCLGSADLFVVQGGFVPWNVVACRAAAAANVPYLVMPQGTYSERSLDHNWPAKKLWSSVFEGPLLRGALGAHLHHEDEKAGLRRLGVAIPTVIAPNGITTLDGIRWDGGSGGYLLYLGRYDVHVKALDILVRSLGLIPESVRPTLRLHGPDHRGGKQRVVTLVHELGLERWVEVGDPIYGSEKWDALTRAAGCVYPSRWDAWPMAVSEAIGAGVPTLVADYALGRLLEEERAAVLCERSPDGVAHGIRRLLSDEGREAASRGPSLATGRLSWSALASSWLQQVSLLVERSVLSSGKGTGSR